MTDHEIKVRFDAKSIANRVRERTAPAIGELPKEFKPGKPLEDRPPATLDDDVNPETGEPWMIDEAGRKAIREAE